MHIISVLESLQVLFLVPIASSEATHAGFCSLPGGVGGSVPGQLCVRCPLTTLTGLSDLPVGWTWHTPRTVSIW